MKNRKIFALCVICVCSFKALIAQQQLVLDQNTRSAVLDSVTHYIDRYYIYPDSAIQMVRYLKQQEQRHTYDTISDPVRFAGFIYRDLHHISQDRHLAVRYAPALEKRILAPPPANTATEPTFDPRDAEENFAFEKLEILPGNIGYIAFTSFDDNSEEARKTVRAAMQFVSHTQALIIDLRSNYGGSGNMVNDMLSFFFDRKTLTGKAYSSITKKWEDTYMTNKPEVTQGLYLGMPLYILISNKTISGGEVFAYTLQTIRKARVFGEVSVGSVHLTRSFALGNGFVGFIPISKSENTISKTDVEGKGIEPDIKVGQDTALSAAEAHILNSLLDSAKTGETKQKVTWAINALKAKNSPAHLRASYLANYTGDYNGILIKLNGDHLVYTNTHDNNKTDTLIPITDDLFQGDFHVQIGFVKDKDGSISSIKLYWNDGWIDTMKKTGR